MFQSSSTCAAAHAASPSARRAPSASASSAEPVSVVTTLSAPSRHGWCRPPRAESPAPRRRSPRPAAGRASRPRPARSARRASRAPIRAPDPSAAPGSHQPFRAGGAIEQQVGAEIFFDLGRDRLRLRRDAVDDRVGEPGQRHARRDRSCRAARPIRRRAPRQRARRRGQRSPRRRAHRPAVEQDRKAVRRLRRRCASR